MLCVSVSDGRKEFQKSRDSVLIYRKSAPYEVKIREDSLKRMGFL